MSYLSNKGVASLVVPVGQEFHFPRFSPLFLIFPQTFLIFVLNLALATPLLSINELLIDWLFWRTV